MRGRDHQSSIDGERAMMMIMAIPQLLVPLILLVQKGAIVYGCSSTQKPVARTCYENIITFNDIGYTTSMEIPLGMKDCVCNITTDNDSSMKIRATLLPSTMSTRCQGRSMQFTREQRPESNTLKSCQTILQRQSFTISSSNNLQQRYRTSGQTSICLMYEVMDPGGVTITCKGFPLPNTTTTSSLTTENVATTKLASTKGHIPPNKSTTVRMGMSTDTNPIIPVTTVSTTRRRNMQTATSSSSNMPTSSIPGLTTQQITSNSNLQTRDSTMTGTNPPITPATTTELQLSRNGTSDIIREGTTSGNIHDNNVTQTDIVTIPPTTTTKTGDQEEGRKIAIIAGVLGGAVVLVVTVIITCVITRKMKKREATEQNSKDQATMVDNDIHMVANQIANGVVTNDDETVVTNDYEIVVTNDYEIVVTNEYEPLQATPQLGEPGVYYENLGKQQKCAA